MSYFRSKREEEDLNKKMTGNVSRLRIGRFPRSIGGKLVIFVKGFVPGGKNSLRLSVSWPSIEEHRGATRTSGAGISREIDDRL